jgi:hypothetical protein
MSNFKEKHFLQEVIINQLTKMFPNLRGSRIFLAILTRYFHDPYSDRVKCRLQCTCYYHQTSYNPHTHTCLPQVVFLVQIVEIRCWIIFRCVLCCWIVLSWFYLTVNTTVENFLKITNLIKFIQINLRI